MYFARICGDLDDEGNQSPGDPDMVVANDRLLMVGLFRPRVEIAKKRPNEVQ